MTGTDTTPGDADAAEATGATAADPDTTEASTAEARHGARAALYGAVAGAFVYPDADRLAELTDDETVAALREAADRLDLLDETGADLLDETAAFVAALRSTTADDLARAYDRLFGLPGDGGTYPVVPYEAAHTIAGDLGQKQRRVATVAGLMERLGVEPAESFHERHDHVAAELELMQVLAGQRAVALAEADDPTAEATADGERIAAAEATVLHEHLSDFVPSLAASVRETADPDDAGEVAYVAAATLAERLVERDTRTHEAPGASAPAEQPEGEIPGAGPDAPPRSGSGGGGA